MSVNFIIDETFTEDAKIKKAITHYKNKFNKDEIRTIQSVPSVFSTNKQIRNIYEKNCDNIYYYCNYMLDSLKTPLIAVLNSTKDYVPIGRKKNKKLYYNFVFNNFVSFLFNTKQGEKYPLEAISLANKKEWLFTPGVLAHDQLSKMEFSRFLISNEFGPRYLPKFILNVLFIVNKIFRNMIWIFIFLASLIISSIRLKKTYKKDLTNTFFFSVFLLTVGYILLVVTTGSASIDRYSLFSDLVFYLSLIYLTHLITNFLNAAYKVRVVI
jgi:hypothetical protein